MGTIVVIVALALAAIAGNSTSTSNSASVIIQKFDDRSTATIHWRHSPSAYAHREEEDPCAVWDEMCARTCVEAGVLV